MISLKHKDESTCRWDSDDPREAAALMSHFSYSVPGAVFTPAYKMGAWDGRIQLVKRTGFGLGMLQSVLDFCAASGIDAECCGDLEARIRRAPSREDVVGVQKFFSGFKFFSGGAEIEPRRDQMAAVMRACLNERAVNVCPTSFGKSLCIFMVALWMLRGPWNVKRLAVVVPTRELVRQLSADFADYCADDVSRMPWTPNVQQLFSGESKELWPGTHILVTTWQSLMPIIAKDPGWLNQFGAMVLDEAHKASGKSIMKCFDSATRVRIRHGWTGSLKDSSLNALQAEAAIGPVLEITTTRELMDASVVAQLTVQPVVVKHPHGARLDYHAEVAAIEESNARSAAIAQLAAEQPGTGLILFRHISHGRALCKLAMEHGDAVFADGTATEWNGRAVKSYADIKHAVEASGKLALVCSFGVFSTGISVKNIHWIIFASPVKSFISVVQSIGRGLRISPTKTKVTLFDIADDMRQGHGSRPNYAWRHHEERMRIYGASGFAVSEPLVVDVAGQAADAVPGRALGANLAGKPRGARKAPLAAKKQGGRDGKLRRC